MKLSDNAKKIIGAVAPGLATALGGPLAGAAATAILSGLGVTKAEEADSAILAAAPETLAKLKESELQFQTRLAELGVDLEKIAADDRKSARDLAKQDSSPQRLISLVVLGIYLLALSAYVYMLVDGTKVNPELLAGMGIILGALLREVPTVMQFWFGSSSGSKDKMDMLSEMHRGSPGK